MASKKLKNKVEEIISVTEETTTNDELQETIVIDEPTIDNFEETEEETSDEIFVEEETETVTEEETTEEVEVSKNTEFGMDTMLDTIVVESKLSAKDLFFATLKDVKHYELTFRNVKVFDTIKDLGIIIPVPMDDVILIGNTYYPYAGLTINVK